MFHLVYQLFWLHLHLLQVHHGDGDVGLVTVGGAPFSIGLQCAFLGEIVCSLDTFLGGTVPTILASDTNIAGTVPTRADSSGFPAGVSGNDPAPLSECVMLWDMCDVPQHYDQYCQA